MTHGKSFPSFSAYNDHTRCKGVCVKKVVRTTSDPPPAAYKYKLDEDAAESFALFIERLVLYTGVKISGGDLAAAVDDPWFAKAKHLLAHYSLDTPTLMEARSERQVPVLQLKHVAAFSVAHVMFNQR